MLNIDGKQFPTVWSELFLMFDDIKGRVDTEQTISFKPMIDWISEYQHVDFKNDSLSGNDLDDLAKRGKILHSYLGTVKNRISHMCDMQAMIFAVACAKTKSGYSSAGTKEMADAARDRLLLTDENYQIGKEVLIHLTAMLETAKELLWNMKDMIEHVQVKLEAMRKEQPKPLIS